MELRIKKVIGSHAYTQRSLALIPWGESLAYIACVGAGAVLIPLERETLKPLDDDQIFFYQPPTPPNLQNTNSNIGRTSPHGSPDSNASISTGSKLVRVNKSGCVDASSASKLVAVGEHGGYMPRIILYNLLNGECSDVARDQHQFGVQFVKFAPSGKYLASIGTPQDGYIYIWNVTNGSLILHASNRCISEVNDLVWINDTQLITVGVRHIKVWNVDSDVILNGRNVVLGPLSDQTFECALPILENEKTSFLVGTSKGSVYRMPGNELLTSQPQKPIRAISKAGHGPRRRLFLSTSSQILEYHETTNESNVLSAPSHVYNTGSPALLSRGDETFFVASHKNYSSLAPLASLATGEIDPLRAGLEALSLSTSVSSFLKKKGIQLRASGSEPHSVLCWNDEDNQVLCWPSELLEVPLTDITAADRVSKEERHLIMGSLSGDLWFGGQQRYNAHDGPVTDVHLRDKSLGISSGRDRCVQVWARNESWSLKQTIMFSTPILKAKLCTNSETQTALVCCGANKTVYIYQTSDPVDPTAENVPIFRDSPRSFLLKGMLFDMAVYQNMVVLTTNDKTVTIVDPWAENKIISSWRPTDSNGDTVNLVHIQVIKHLDTLILLGAANNKSVLLFSLLKGELLASQWGHGDAISGVAWSGRELITASDTLIISDLCLEQKANAEPNTGKIPHMIPTTVGFETPLPRLSLPGASPSVSRSPSPIRKVFETGSGSVRSRSVSPVRSSNTPRTDINRSPSPPPRLHTRSPTLDRGRPGVKAAGTVSMTPLKQPNLSYKPLKLGAPPSPSSSPPSAQTQSNIIKNQSTDSSQRLISALNEFLNNPVSQSDAPAVKPLLISALHKVDGMAMLDEYTKNLSTQLCEKVESQISSCFDKLSARKQPDA